MSLARAGSTEGHQRVAEGALLLDVRTPREYSAGHIDGALNIPVDELGDRLSELGSRDRAIVVYCHSGRRSRIAARLLREQGFAVTDVGPMDGWRPPAGQPRVCSGPKSCDPGRTNGVQPSL